MEEWEQAKGARAFAKEEAKEVGGVFFCKEKTEQSELCADRVGMTEFESIDCVNTLCSAGD